MKILHELNLPNKTAKFGRSGYMERIEFYQKKKGHTKFSMISSLVVFLLSMPVLVYCLIAGFRTEFPNGDWNAVLVPVLAILFFFSGYSTLKMKQFFIEWDDEKLSYFLPKSKTTTTIKFSDIRKVTIDLLEIKIHLPEKEHSIHLGIFPFNELRRIKEKFEELNADIDKLERES